MTLYGSAVKRLGGDGYQVVECTVRRSWPVWPSTQAAAGNGARSGARKSLNPEEQRGTREKERGRVAA